MNISQQLLFQIFCNDFAAEELQHDQQSQLNCWDKTLLHIIRKYLNTEDGHVKLANVSHLPVDVRPESTQLPTRLTLLQILTHLDYLATLEKCGQNVSRQW